MVQDKSTRGSSSQFFVAGELCRRGLVAVVTLGNCPNTDILCSNVEGTRFAHIQVKTFIPGNKTCSVGTKAEKDYGKNFFWVLAGIPRPGQGADFVYYVVPSKEMARHVSAEHRAWVETPGRSGQPHRDNPVRIVQLPPRKSPTGWDISEYRDRWNLIAEKLKA